MLEHILGYIYGTFLLGNEYLSVLFCFVLFVVGEIMNDHGVF